MPVSEVTTKLIFLSFALLTEHEGRPLPERGQSLGIHCSKAFLGIFKNVWVWSLWGLEGAGVESQ